MSEQYSDLIVTSIGLQPKKVVPKKEKKIVRQENSAAVNSIVSINLSDYTTESRDHYDLWSTSSVQKVDVLQ